MKKLNFTIYILITALFAFTSQLSMSQETAKIPTIAEWYNNKEAAVSLRFDDNLDSHLHIAVPVLNDFDMKGTFMVSPGRSSYKKNKQMWEEQVVQMGHHLGNHTMSHSGAKDLKAAAYEIGETTKIIRNLNIYSTDLMVFASGGGKSWGGKRWSDADPAYHLIAAENHLIDLYDGNHKSFRVDGDSETAKLCEQIDKTLADEKHQPFHFHNIGKRSMLEYLKDIKRGYQLSVSEEVFRGFIECIQDRRDRVWITAMLDILKYEEQRKGAELTVEGSVEDNIKMSLAVQTDPSLYDHELSILIPLPPDKSVESVTQDGTPLEVTRIEDMAIVNVEPKNSMVEIRFRYS